jgi:hypothetical protein
MGLMELFYLKPHSLNKDSQKMIASEVQRRKEEAQRLRTEAEKDWNDVKRWIEEELLGKG